MEKLVIKSQYYTISRECLEYLISGKLPHLKYLEIASKALGSIDGKKDNIWDRLKNYFESSIKEYYKINITNRLGKLLCFTAIDLTGGNDQSLHGEVSNSSTKYHLEDENHKNVVTDDEDLYNYYFQVHVDTDIHP